MPESNGAGAEWTVKRLRQFTAEALEPQLGGAKGSFDSRFKAYYGDVDDGKPHGQGLALMHDGSRYGGSWVHGKREGRGVLDIKEGGYYDGEWRDDKYNGKGKLTFPDGSVYIGEFRDGVRSGVGTQSSKEYKYEGTWSSDLPHSANCKFTGMGGALATLLTFGKGTSGSQALKMLLIDKYGGGIKSYEGPIHKEYGRHGKGRTEYRNGEVYTGDYDKNKRHGRGRMVYENGDRYEGSWAHDNRSGKGTHVYAAGGKYEGDWLGDQKHGFGMREYHNGDKYVGEWEQNEISGRGKMTYRNGDEYEGEWKSGRRHGHGEFRFQKQGAVYKGPLINGLFHTADTELGRMQFASGNVFMGSFNKGERAKGIMWFHDGSVFYGDWRNDKPHGKGLMWYGNGDFYYGNWLRSERHGLGCTRYADGGEYQGEWKEGRRHGMGTMQRVNGTIIHGLWEMDEPKVRYDGEWRAGTYHGIGKYFYACGSQYYGIWLEGLKHIKGAMVFADGGVYKGEWNKDIIHGKGQMCYPNGTLYDGMWYQGQRSGYGIMKEPSGTLYAGEWAADVCCGKGFRYDVDRFKPKQGSTVSTSDCEDLCTVAGMWNTSGRLNGPVTAFFNSGRVIQVMYDDGLERSAIEPRNTSTAPASPCTACRLCNQTFGLTRWRYVCQGCWFFYCGSCLKDLKYAEGFGKFSSDGIPQGEKMMDGKACQECATAAMMGTSVAIIWDKAVVFKGVLRQGTLHGPGIKWMASGDVYIGYMARDLENGHGNLVEASGEEYMGQWKDGKKSGLGFQRLLDGTVQEGHFECGTLLKVLYHGEMKRITRNGAPSSITEKLIRHGLGKATYSDGSEYNGNHVDGKREGYGVMRYTTGETFVGEWKEGLRHGRGVATVPGTMVYAGCWQEDKKHGKGTLYDRQAGTTYQGEWVNDKISGVVVVRKPTGDVYCGVWSDGEERKDIFRPPTMVNDAESDACCHCGKLFNLIRRRHHCRGCGLLFCNDCSSSQRLFPSHFNYQSPQRCCKICDVAFSKGLSLGIEFRKDGTVVAGTWCEGVQHDICATYRDGACEIHSYKHGNVVNEGCKIPKTEAEFNAYFNALATASGTGLTFPDPTLESVAKTPPDDPSAYLDVSPSSMTFDPRDGRKRKYQKVSPPNAPPRPKDPPPKPQNVEMVSDEQFDEILKQDVAALPCPYSKVEHLTLDPPIKPPPDTYAAPTWSEFGPKEKALKPDVHSATASSTVLVEKRAKEDTNGNRFLQAVTRPMAIATSAAVAVVSTPAAALSSLRSRETQDSPVLPGPVLTPPCVLVGTNINTAKPVLHESWESGRNSPADGGTALAAGIEKEKNELLSKHVDPAIVEPPAPTDVATPKPPLEEPEPPFDAGEATAGKADEDTLDDERAGLLADPSEPDPPSSGSAAPADATAGKPVEVEGEESE